MDNEVEKTKLVQQQKSQLNLALVLTGVVMLVLLVILFYQNLKLKQELMQLKNPPANQITTLPSPSPIQLSSPKIADPSANWKTYTNKALTFKYPDYMSEDGSVLISQSPNFKVVAAEDSYMMNECMEQFSTEKYRNLVLRQFKRVVTGEMCSGGDATARETWVVKSADSFGPGITIEYFESNSATIKPIIYQILSTFRFIDEPTGSVCGGWNTGGEIICSCTGTLTKEICPKDAVCDSGDYFCSGQCGSCCWKGLPDNPLYPRCKT
mgnify:CR=1 FL=1